MQKLVAVFLTPSVLLSSCYGIHGSKPLDNLKGLEWSCRVSDEVDMDYHVGLEFMFENKISYPVDIAINSAKFFPETTDAKLLNTEELKTFWESYKLRYDEVYARRQNKDKLMLTLGAGLAVIAVAAAASRGSGGGGMGFVPDTIFTAPLYHVDSPRLEVYPDSHLLGPEFQISPGGYVRRLAIFSYQDLHQLDGIEVCFEKPEKKCSKMKLISYAGNRSRIKDKDATPHLDCEFEK